MLDDDDTIAVTTLASVETLGVMTLMALSFTISPTLPSPPFEILLPGERSMTGKGVGAGAPGPPLLLPGEDVGANTPETPLLPGEGVGAGGPRPPLLLPVALLQPPLLFLPLEMLLWLPQRLPESDKSSGGASSKSTQRT